MLTCMATSSHSYRMKGLPGSVADSNDMDILSLPWQYPEIFSMVIGSFFKIIYISEMHSIQVSFFRELLYLTYLYMALTGTTVLVRCWIVDGNKLMQFERQMFDRLISLIRSISYF